MVKNSSLAALVVFATLLGGTTLGRGAEPGDVPESSADDYFISRTSDMHLVILGCYRTFRAAESDAKAFSRRLRIPLDMREIVFDAKRGLILSDKANDPMYAGEYVLRRYDTRGDGDPFLSIEKSEAYSGLRPGYYIIVGRILGDRLDARNEARRFSAVAPGAYFARTSIYYGCMH